MRIKTLADVKKEMKAKRPFYVVNHRVLDYIGQIRIANIIQSNGVYLHVYGEPINPTTLANNGRGSWLEYGKASDWEIDDLTGHCILYSGEHKTDNLVFEIVFLSDECIAELEDCD